MMQSLAIATSQRLRRIESFMDPLDSLFFALSRNVYEKYDWYTSSRAFFSTQFNDTRKSNGRKSQLGLFNQLEEIVKKEHVPTLLL